MVQQVPRAHPAPPRCCSPSSSPGGECPSPTPVPLVLVGTDTSGGSRERSRAGGSPYLLLRVRWAGRGRGGPRGGAAGGGRAGSPRLPDRAAQPQAPSASDGGGGDRDRGAAAAATAATDTPPGGGSSPLAFKGAALLSPRPLHAVGRRGHQGAALNPGPQERKHENSERPQTWTLWIFQPGLHPLYTPLPALVWGDREPDVWSGCDANCQGICLALGGYNTYKEPQHVWFWVVAFIPLQNHSNETSLLPGFGEQLVVSKVALLVHLLAFPFEVCRKDLDLRLTPTSARCAHRQCACLRCPDPLRRLESQRPSPCLPC